MINWEQIDRLAKNARLVSPSQSTTYLRHQLEIWWSITFKRPLKDPLLKEYTLDELAYEYLIHFYLNPDNDPKKERERKQQEEEEKRWALEQMKKEKQKKKSAEKGVEDSKPKKTQKPSQKDVASASGSAPGTDGLFIKPNEVPDIPMADLPDISTDFRE